MTIENVQSQAGNIVITLYGSDPARWLQDEGSLHIYTVPARAPATRTCIVLPGPNRYAIAIYHDRNGNALLDRRLRMPREGVGSSRDPCTGWREPRLHEALMTVDRADMTTSVWLRHPFFFPCRPD